MPTPFRIAFAGTPEFAVPALDALVSAGHEVVGVWTQPDRPAGRGRKLGASPVKRRALALHLPIFQPATFKSAAAQAELESVKPRLMVVAAYGLLLPKAVLAVPEFGCLNIHASLLPRWRGAAPIQRALLAGDAQTGVSIMHMQAGLDTGPVYATRSTPISADDTGGSLHARLAQLGAQLLLQVLAQLPGLKPLAQDVTRATYAAKLTRAEAQLDWTRPAAELARAVRAFNPWPMAWTLYRGEPLRIVKAVAQDAATPAAPGSVLMAGHEGVDVATGRGVLRIIELQAAGGRAMAAADFSRARALAGLRFG
ncbi:MAG: methionyl-tRNA formyltransferase [Gammaproteobacteria bacterium]|nr:methionyl-tRNA formyltransferase [Gammaproteobacteria bacterium]MBU6510007.1 methionyl-tRNA formyltransferase [Gammaproteobacteria bacterium]MDE1984199.1 methionyl-tRNA formyltransferase [Gammaproteobacteria bacterium]MDE2108885.1 methionyl-tRNA formyltransferase [Gammaproteobacteria bacterium]MDE2461262.1 methionyl-tRNA formyltransferase [Gammaproteobacteria bacterium]